MHSSLTMCFQVFWNNGAQIIPPHDANISASIEANLEMDDASWDIAKVLTHVLRKNPSVEIDSAYFQQLSPMCRYK